MSALFDRSVKALQRKRILSDPQSAKTYFFDLGIENIVNRLYSVKGRDFSNTCYIGPMGHLFVEQVSSLESVQGVTLIDFCKESLDYSLSESKKITGGLRVTGLHLDEEEWNFPENYFNLIVNNFQMHWMNVISGTAEKWLKSLVPDGALVGTLMGGDTLQELRIALTLAEQEREGGVSTHVSPMLNIPDVGNLFNRLHFKLVTTNADTNTLYFDSMFSLMAFLQALGENNAANTRREALSRETFVAASAIYEGLFAEKEGSFQGKLPATFDVVHYIAWKEHESQQKPLQRGARGIDIKTLAEEVEDDEMEMGEIQESEESVELKYTKRK